MFAALQIPDFHLQAQLRQRPAWRGSAVALLDGGNSRAKGKAKSRVLQVTPEAARSGVEPGMTATRAQARCPGIVLTERHPEDEEAARELLWACAARVTPDYEATGPGLVVLDLGGTRGDLPEQAAGGIRWLAEVRLPARAGLGGNPDLAVLAARLGNPVRVLDGSAERIREQLAILPVTVLQPPAEWGDVFAWWGIRTVGDLGRLPRQELTERLGPGAGRLWDQARGEARRLLRLVRPSAVYREAAELEIGVETAEALRAWCRRFLERIVARLAGAYLAVGILELELGIEGHAPHRRTLRIPDPTRDVDLLGRLLDTHLDTFTSPGPVVSVALEAFPTRTEGGQTQLFRGSWKDPNRLTDTVARLEARLGLDRVGVPETGLDHRPDRFRMHPFPAPHPSPRTGGEELRAGPPLRRFRPRRPVAVATGGGRAAGPQPESILAGPMQGTLGEARGPWRVSGGWWEGGGWNREEWEVRHEDGTLLRLVSEEGKWYVEGAYD